MATFYTDSGSFAKLDISGSGQDIFTVSGSSGGLLEVSDLTAGANVFQISSASIDLFTIDQSKNAHISGSLRVTGSLVVNGSTISAGAIRSYFDNGVSIINTTAVTVGGASVYMIPFMMPYNISVSYIRMPISNALASTAIATTANTTLNLRQTNTFWFNIYSAGNGASSLSLQYLTQASATMVYAVTAQQGAASSNQSVSQAITYFAEGFSTNTFSTSYQTTGASLSINTNNVSNFTGLRWLDIPFNASLASGQWWGGVQRSTSFATTGGGGNFSTLTMQQSLIMASQTSLNFNPIGATVASTNPYFIGNGFAQVSANGLTTNSIGINSISAIANQPRLPFQFLRFE